MLPEDGDMLDQSGSESTAEADRAEETLASERENTISWIREQVARARPISGTPAERYLIEYRGLHPPWPSSLHWAARYQSHPGAMSRSCLIATVTNAEGDRRPTINRDRVGDGGQVFSDRQAETLERACWRRCGVPREPG
jgi:hypothetical protein